MFDHMVGPFSYLFSVAKPVSITYKADPSYPNKKAIMYETLKCNFTVCIPMYTANNCKYLFYVILSFFFFAFIEQFDS